MLRKPDPKPEDDKLDLAACVQRVSEGMTRLLKSGLNRDAIIVLLKDETGLAKRAIDRVLLGLDVLAKRYTSAK